MFVSKIHDDVTNLTAIDIYPLYFCFVILCWFNRDFTI